MPCMSFVISVNYQSFFIEKQHVGKRLERFFNDVTTNNPGLSYSSINKNLLPSTPPNPSTPTGELFRWG